MTTRTTRPSGFPNTPHVSCWYCHLPTAALTASNLFSSLTPPPPGEGVPGQRLRAALHQHRLRGGPQEAAAHCGHRHLCKAATSHYLPLDFTDINYPKLDTRISVRPPSFSVTLRVPPLDSETGWTGELWSKTNLLNWQN